MSKRDKTLKDILDCGEDQVKCVGVGYRNRRESDNKLYRRFETHGEEKANCITTVQTDSMVAEPIRIGALPRPNGELSQSQAFRIYDTNGKSVTINAGGGGAGGKTGLYAIPHKVGEIGNGGQGNRIYSIDGKSVAQTATSGGVGSNTGLYAIPTDKSIYLPTFSTLTNAPSTAVLSSQ